MTHVTDGLARVRARVAAAAREYGRDPAAVRLVAVSKRQPAAAIQQAAAAGQLDFGENLVQEALPKIELVGHERVRWHFVGPIQSNKTRPIAAHFDWVHSVDRAKIARRLNDQRSDHAAQLQVCIEVKLACEPQKAGVAPQALSELAEIVTALPRLRLRGLMCIPPPEREFSRQREAFRRLHHCLRDLQARGYELDTLSMGMSDDLEAAIAEGATMVRVGTAVFGPRQS